MKKIPQSKLKPGCWYWWVLPRALHYPHRRAGLSYDKFCVVRCGGPAKARFVNISSTLEEEDSYYVGHLAGHFYGPVTPPPVKIPADYQS